MRQAQGYGKGMIAAVHQIESILPMLQRPAMVRCSYDFCGFFALDLL